MTRTDLAILRDQLKRDEGLKLLPYVDSVGRLTIGYGRNLSENGITQDEAGMMLTQDIERHNADLYRAFPIIGTLNVPRQIVLCNMCFNLGIVKLKRFVNMWAAIEDGDYVQAANEMLNSLWAKQTGVRATRLAASMASGVLQ